MNNDFFERRMIPTIVTTVSVCAVALTIALTVRFIAELFDWM